MRKREAMESGDLFEEFAKLFGKLEKLKKIVEVSMNTNSPCLKCIGYGEGCTIILERDPEKECPAFAEREETGYDKPSITN